MTNENTSSIISHLRHQVFLGRPVLWGLATNGEEGVTHMLSLIREDLENIMANSGKGNQYISNIINIMMNSGKSNQ